MITIVDYGMGNLGSVLNMFKRIGVKATITSDQNELHKAEKILLPGVGAFDNAMKRIQESGLLPILNEKALVQKVPVLGICLGMQLLTDSSEEGTLQGLGWIKGKTLSFKKNITDPTLKVPHMGWNTVWRNAASPITNEFEGQYRFYFVHSYFVRCENSENSILRTNYGLEFDSGIQKDNIFGAQFHPEKSHKFGMKLLENFAKI